MIHPVNSASSDMCPVSVFFQIYDGDDLSRRDDSAVPRCAVPFATLGFLILATELPPL